MSVPLLPPLLPLPPPMPGVAKWGELIGGRARGRRESDAPSVAEGGVRARLGTRFAYVCATSVFVCVCVCARARPRFAYLRLISRHSARAHYTWLRRGGVCFPHMPVLHITCAPSRRLPGCGGAVAGGDGLSQRHQLVHREGLDPESAEYILELHERLLRVVKTQPSARPEDGQPEEVNGTHSDQDGERVGLLERSGEEEEEEEEPRDSALLARQGEWKATRKVLSAVSPGLESAERDETNAEIQEGDELSEEDQDSEVDTQGQDWEGGEGWADADYEELKDEEGNHEVKEEERTTSCP
jgi:hypothetical protein